jgi:hypothetical protein
MVDTRVARRAVSRVGPRADKWADLKAAWKVPTLVEKTATRMASSWVECSADSKAHQWAVWMVDSMGETRAVTTVEPMEQTRAELRVQTTVGLMGDWKADSMAPRSAGLWELSMAAWTVAKREWTRDDQMAVTMALTKVARSE